ncbi:hypothetical protein RQM47_13405 [Rubrivirga sp. S365]|uniref:hypothetical protein n=1 Tax=Rubrivirga sp. S365 TaxID=3076080 RepID=UPI0028C6D1FC|nr:hypothetical protein [Rubrivirga sp. S365]MDT7857644.1 hypothetical protein [Rubrivirga sp. S365]
MAEWFQVFDDERVLVSVRTRARRLVVAFALVSGGLVALAPLSTLVAPAHAGLAALACGVVLTAYAAWLLRRLGRLHRRLWRIELSFRRAVAHDAGGRRVALAWQALDQIDVRTDGLVLSGRTTLGRRVRLHVAASMPQFARFAHRAVEYAEAFGRPVWVEGQPWEAIDVTSIHPGLRTGSAVA